MAKKVGTSKRREDSLSRESIIEASIELLDASGEAGLTFRTLSERLATGPGAIYWHIANKSELLTAACDAVIARTMQVYVVGTTPRKIIRSLALGLFDAIDEHPWIGSALTRSPGQMPMVRIFEPLGQQVRALGVPERTQWAAVSTLLSYILGVAGRNAANGEYGRAHELDRATFLDSIAAGWLQLDPRDYPFAHSMASHLRAHDDRKDFLAGLDHILAGIAAPRVRS